MKDEELFVKRILLLTALSTIIILFLVIIFIFKESIPVFTEYGVINFILGTKWNPTGTPPQFGMIPLIVGSLALTLLTLLIATPFSVLCAIFIAELAPSTMRKILKPVIETLAGIPSVVYGFFGLILLVPFIRTHLGGTGFGLFTASLILTIMIMPTIISISHDAIRSVPLEYKEASLALGATHWQTIKNVILPAAFPGIVVGIILGMARAIGETLAVIMVAGNVPQIPHSILDPIRALTSNIALEMGYATGLHYSALFGTAVVLFIFTLILLLIANYFQHKTRVRIGGGYL
ncbi:phosphate ABC transporter membrane protein 1, PhoT family [Methanothermus fervidus DSM 2088]|uniref:Phosphate transport system permease protein n=1 Tax=Methanothermus fervidus (strain ATCC 43054 / DSM 2088 / JCM 10308 / V24 S) TaxID=523846 RepID=E3GXP1_METFV|nr:phosphate ABC transporter membrane protein 1, PhoT family [Methanothermus fervidus DSM 2088]